MTRTLTVVPPAREGDGAQVTKGTKIHDETGEALTGVTKIELVAGLNDCWRGTIHTTHMLLPPEGIVAEFSEIRKSDPSVILHYISVLVQSIVDQTGDKPGSLSVQYDETMGLVDSVTLGEESSLAL